MAHDLARHDLAWHDLAWELTLEFLTPREHLAVRAVCTNLYATVQTRWQNRVTHDLASVQASAFAARHVPVHAAAGTAALLVECAVANRYSFAVQRVVLSQYVPRVDVSLHGVACTLRSEHGFPLHQTRSTEHTQRALSLYGSWLLTPLVIDVAATRPRRLPWCAAWAVRNDMLATRKRKLHCSEAALHSTGTHSVVCTAVNGWQLVFEPTRAGHVHVYIPMDQSNVPMPLGTVMRTGQLCLCGLWAGQSEDVCTRVRDVLMIDA